ncbi:MAG TPA: hypothetical protein VER55_03965 [Ardenticatenaceae bacterium]|nr:hypothetical protein [Ardenticatenaceae bacterium]
MDYPRGMSEPAFLPQAVLVAATRSQLRRFTPAIERAGYALTIVPEARDTLFEDLALNQPDLVIVSRSADGQGALAATQLVPQAAALVLLDGDDAYVLRGFAADERVPFDPPALEALLRVRAEEARAHRAAPVEEPAAPDSAAAAEDQSDLAGLSQGTPGDRPEIADEQRARVARLAQLYQYAELEVSRAKEKAVAALEAMAETTTQQQPDTERTVSPGPDDEELLAEVRERSAALKQQQVRVEHLAQAQYQIEAKLANVREHAASALGALANERSALPERGAAARLARETQVVEIDRPPVLEIPTIEQWVPLDPPAPSSEQEEPRPSGVSQHQHVELADLREQFGALLAELLSQQRAYTERLEKTSQEQERRLVESRQQAEAEIARLRAQAVAALAALANEQQAYATRLAQARQEQERQLTEMRQQVVSALAEIHHEQLLHARELARARQDERVQLIEAHQEELARRAELRRQQEADAERIAQLRQAEELELAARRRQAEEELALQRQQAITALVDDVTNRYMLHYQHHRAELEALRAAMTELHDRIITELQAQVERLVESRREQEPQFAQPQPEVVAAVPEPPEDTDLPPPLAVEAPQPEPAGRPNPALEAPQPGPTELPGAPQPAGTQSGAPPKSRRHRNRRSRR